MTNFTYITMKWKHYLLARALWCTLRVYCISPIILGPSRNGGVTPSPACRLWRFNIHPGEARCCIYTPFLHQTDCACLVKLISCMSDTLLLFSWCWIDDGGQSKLAAGWGTVWGAGDQSGWQELHHQQNISLRPGSGHLCLCTQMAYSLPSYLVRKKTSSVEFWKA